jgi:argininosuccinate lyase
MWREDIQGSIAHARGLQRAGVLAAGEVETLVRGLEQIRGEIESGAFVWKREREDVHMNIEARLTEICGPVGGKLHTGRSRNDQVATDLRLWARRKTDEAIAAVEGLGEAILGAAERELDTLMPAYTHLQRAQPSRLSHHLMAWQEMLLRDRGRLRDARVRLNESPLGAGAVAGTGFPLDRAGVAAELGFDGPTQNSIDATGSRDFLMELANALGIVLWSSQEFGFVALSAAFSTSSSMMPQKKNPDVAELVRGKAARLMGSVTTLMALEKSLFFGYGRDLQEDKRPIFDAFDCALVSLYALTGAIATAEWRRERLRAALDQGHLCATDLADFLVQQGLPFREAHHVVGALVREAETHNVQLGELPADVLVAAHASLVGDGLRSALDPAAAVERRSLLGGPARATVEKAIATARTRWSQ